MSKRDTIANPEVGDFYRHKTANTHTLIARIRDKDNATILVNSNGTYVVATAGGEAFKAALEDHELVKAAEDHPHRVEYNANWNAVEEMSQYLVIIIRLLEDIANNTTPAKWDGADIT